MPDLTREIVERELRRMEERIPLLSTERLAVDLCRALLAAWDREARLRAALERFFSLPNWENRCGEWNDVNNGLHQLREALERKE